MQFCFNSRISARSDVDELVIALSSWKKTETTHTLREFYFCPKDRFESRSLLFQWVSPLFYSIDLILKIRIVKARDITSRALMQFYGIPLDDNDDDGQPPYPLIKFMEPEALEFITCWLDHYALTANDTPGSIVGYVKEFKEQQKTGMSEFKLPPIP